MFVDPQAQLERFAEDLARYGLLQASGRERVSAFEHQGVGEGGRDLFEVMGHENHRRAGRVPGPGREVGDELFPTADVESGGRFVEQHDARLVHQHAGEEHALALAGRQRGKRVRGERAAAPLPQELVRALAVGVGVPMPPGRERRITRGHDHLGRGHRRFELGCERGRRERDAFAQCPHVGATEPLAEDLYCARRGVLVERRDP